MYNFKACRLDNQVVINEEHHYRQGEILTYYLNTDFSELRQWYLDCLKYEGKVRYPIGDISYDYNRVVHKVQNFFTYVDTLVQKLPPIKQILSPKDIWSNALFWLLSSQAILFRNDDVDEEDTEEYQYSYLPDDMDLDDYEIEDMDDHEQRKLANEFGRKPVDYSRPDMLTDFTPAYFREELEPLGIELNKRITKLYDSYMSFAAEILRVPQLYSNLLDNYIHICDSIQEPTLIAEAYQHFLDEQKQKRDHQKTYVFDRMTGVTDTITTHTVMPVKDEHGDLAPRLWEITEYGSIGAFLYTELFDGFRSGLLPKRCKNCGKYFLLSSGYNTDFCDRKAPGEISKTCRDIGARKRYDDKVKNDPVWLAYQRAYKAHYARVSKKKMTKPEFAAWSELAVELRTMALEGDLEFDEYTRVLKR